MEVLIVVQEKREITDYYEEKPLAYDGSVLHTYDCVNRSGVFFRS